MAHSARRSRDKGSEISRMCIDGQEKIIIMLQTRTNGLTYKVFLKAAGKVRFC